MTEYINREAAIAYIREQSEECQKAFEELGGESGIYADAYNDLAEDFYKIPAADVAPVRRARWIPFHSEAAGDIQYCSDCKIGNAAKSDFCPHCGAMMDGGAARAESTKLRPSMQGGNLPRENDFCNYGEPKDGGYENGDK